MDKSKKLLGENRRQMIIKWLKESLIPLTGTELSKRTNVSRQVIVQDISILKAKNYPILATAQGYLLYQNEEPKTFSKMVACCHTPEETKEELFILVDHGVMVKDVTVEHPIYGEITASLRLSSRHDVEQFCDKLQKTNASLLSDLTKGVHLHTLEASTEEALLQAIQGLNEHGFLLIED
ncbi:transcriptional regulator [Alkalihalobacillus trypoxylicola]|uniref:Transcriptional regulator n=1 Tax=Alkalihalobacillus trypoxylicola TaxID=519424 RepID=A0A161PGF2_9BACI|nr:transcription repressor NadR [Alkalihalobacillus trypoxylicola]KYG31854.1 transcriptional regulator [Alkalihalobacillus trypoxylicola]